MKRDKEGLKEDFSQSVDKIFAPIVVEIMTRTAMMAYVSVALGGLDSVIYKADALLAPDGESPGLPNSQFQQFKEITLNLEDGEELSFIARVPEGYNFSDLVEPNPEFIEMVKNLDDKQILELSCSPVQEQIPLSVELLDEVQKPSLSF